MKMLMVILGVLLITGCAEVVDTGERGVEVRYGEVISESMPEGFYWYNPITSNIVALDTRVQKWEDSTAVYTKDVQQATVSFAITYNLDPKQAHMIYKDVGLDWANKLMPQVVVGAMKDSVGRWEAEKLITNRDVAQKEAEASIRLALSSKNIQVKAFQITNIDYSDQFEKAVEDKVVAQQRAIEEANRTKQVEEQAKQIVEKAKADAQSISIRASALEKNGKLVELEAVNKWDGKLPQYVLGNTMPFINIK